MDSFIPESQEVQREIARRLGRELPEAGQAESETHEPDEPLRVHMADDGDVVCHGTMRRPWR